MLCAGVLAASFLLGMVQGSLTSALCPLLPAPSLSRITHHVQGPSAMNMNMDFKALRERAAAAASEATNAVSQFTELDALAEADDYLKTDDLNVKGQNKKEKWVEDLGEEGDNGGGGGAAGSASAVVSAPNTATKPAAHEMMTPSFPPPLGATPATSHMLAHHQSSVGYESAHKMADDSETPALDSIFGQEAEQASQHTVPFASPEERAQQLIAQALFQTPMSSMAPSRGASTVGETSFLDYDSAREEEGEGDINNDGDDDKGGESNAALSEHDTERENAVMDYLSKNSAGDSFSILDKVISSSQSQSAETKKPSTALADLDSALGNDLSITAADVNEQPKREVNNSYMLSAVADLMNGNVISSPPVVTQDQGNEQKVTKHPTSFTVGAQDSNQNTQVENQPTQIKAAALDYDSDNSSSAESDWGGNGQQDPVLSLMQKEGRLLGGRAGSGTMITNVQPQQTEEAVTLIQSGVGGSLYDGQHGVRRKDPNRFISDIDRRAAPLDVEIGGGLGTTGAALNGIPQELLDGTPSKTDVYRHSSSQQPFGDASNKFQWFKQAAMGKVIQSVSKLEMALSPTARNSVASRRDPRANSANERGGDTTEDEYSKVVSSSLLADEEHRELMRLKQNALENQNIVAKLIDLIQSNPRFAFIGFTLVLLYMVSHWTRKRTEDDVTR